MAAPHRIHTLNLGSQTVGLAEFQVTPHGGLALARYVSTEIIADPASPATETERQSKLQNAVQELRTKVGLKSGIVNYAIPSQQVFTRFVKLPSVAAEKVDQIIHFEAQQNVPFPIDEVVWDYQLVSSKDSDQVEVALFAVKADLLDELNSAVEAAKFKAGLVDVAPMALYNAFRYNYSDIEGCSLLVDIGARTTNLLFVEGGRMFARTIQVGGANTITSQIAKEIGWHFAQAEEKKRAEGFVGLGGAYADPPDPDVALMSKVIRQTMTRLHQQIVQSVSIYKAQQGGKALDRVYLCGGSVALPYMREFFTEKMNCPIEFFNPLRNVSVTNDVDIEEIVQSAHVLGELVGLALRGMGSCPVELNLRPASVVRAQALAARTPFIVMASICLILITVLGSLYFYHANAVQENAVEKLTAKVDQMAADEKKFKSLKTEIGDLEQKSKPLVQTIDSKDYWVNVLNHINACLPGDDKHKPMWITSFKPQIAAAAPAGPAAPPTGAPKPPQKPGQKPAAAAAPAVPSYSEVVIKGLFLHQGDTQEDKTRADGLVAEFARNLVKQPSVFEDLPVDKVIQSFQEQNDSAWAFGFELKLKLKTPLPAQ